MEGSDPGVGPAMALASAIAAGEKSGSRCRESDKTASVGIDVNHIIHYSGDVPEGENESWRLWKLASGHSWKI